jgi:hypothetical protein
MLLSVEEMGFKWLEEQKKNEENVKSKN